MMATKTYMTLNDFIVCHKVELDKAIHKIVPPHYMLDNISIEWWILHHDDLSNWARSEGVILYSSLW
jgi:hypothetical protein